MHTSSGGGARPFAALLERLRETFALDSVTLLERRTETPPGPDRQSDPTAWTVAASIGEPPCRHYDVDLATDGAAALRLATAHTPDLVVLDLGLPDMDGVEVIRRLRTWTSIPIIVVSGRAGSADKIDALDAGADDYVTKPFGVDELLARIRAVTRRAAPADANPPTVRIGQSTVDLAKHTVTAADGTELRLTPTEWQLLEILVRNPAGLSANATCSTSYGVSTTNAKPTTYASTWPNCDASSNPTPAAPAICSPNPAWATASDPPTATNNRTRRPHTHPDSATPQAPDHAAQHGHHEQTTARSPANRPRTTPPHAFLTLVIRSSPPAGKG